MFSCKHVSSFGNTFYHYLTVSLKTCYPNTVQIFPGFFSCILFIVLKILFFRLFFRVFSLQFTLRFYCVYMLSTKYTYLVLDSPMSLSFLLSVHLCPPHVLPPVLFQYSVVSCVLSFILHCLLFLISFSCSCFPGVFPPPNCPFSIQSVVSSHQSLSQCLSSTLTYSDSGLFCCGFCILDCFKNLMRYLLS